MITVVPPVSHLMELDPTHMVWERWQQPHYAGYLDLKFSTRNHTQEDPFDFFEEVFGG